MVMPRIIVMSEPDTEGERETTLDERVASAHLGDASQSAQLIERVGWAVHDADEVERDQWFARWSA
jgi:hypothetical protein